MAGNILPAEAPACSLSEVLPDVPTGRIDSLLASLGFPYPNRVVIDLVLPRLSEALHQVDRCFTSELPEPVQLLADELDFLLERYPLRELINRSPGTRSKSAGNPNPIYGELQTYPMRGIVSITREQVQPGDTDKFHVGLGLLILSRLVPDAPTQVSEPQNVVATKLRLCFTAESWQTAKSVFPEPGPEFFHSLRHWKNHKQATFLTDSQKELFSKLVKLIDNPLLECRTRSRIREALPDEHDDNVIPAWANLALRPLPWPTQDVSSAGELDPDDSSTTPLLHQIVLTDIAPQCEDAKRVFLMDAAHRFARDNQFLPYRWHSLLIEETREVARIGEEMLAHRDTRAIALVGLLVLLTGHHPADLADFQLVANQAFAPDKGSWSDNIVDLSSQCWWHRGPLIANRFTPHIDQLSSLKPYTRWIGLSLPDVLIPYLRPENDVLSCFFAKHVGANENGLTTLLEIFCRAVRDKAPWVRVFPARLRAQPFDWWMARTNDDTLASLASAVTEYAPSAPLYYYAASSEEIRQRHLERMKELGWQTSSLLDSTDSMFGSRLQPSPEAVTVLISHLSETLEQARLDFERDRSPETLADLHNGMVLYTLTMLIFGTGHRLAAEYCFSRHTLGIDDHLVVLADKIMNAANASRLVALPEICAAQVREYLHHLEWLGSRLSRYAPAMAVRVRSIIGTDPLEATLPLFGLLSPDLEIWKNLGVEDLKQRLGTHWPLPLNTPRHLLPTETRHLSLSAEMNHIRAGHIQTGQNPWSHWSPLTPFTVLTDSAKIADELLQHQGWTVRAGGSGRSRKPSTLEQIAPSREDPAYRVAPLERARAMGTQKIRRVVRTAIERAKSQNPERKLSDSDIKAITREILNNLAGDPNAASVALALLRGAIRRQGLAKHGTTAPELIIPLVDPPVFGPYVAIELEQAKALQNAFLRFYAAQKTTSHIDTLAYIVLSSIILGGIVRTDWLGPTLDACRNAYPADGRLWFEIRCRAESDGELTEFVRRPFDPITTCLVLRAREEKVLSPSQTIDIEAVRKKAGRLLADIVNADGTPGLPSSIRAACQLMTTHFRFMLPGMLAGIGDGRADSFCLPRSDHLRITGNETAPETLPQPHRIEPNSALPRIKHQSTGSRSQARQWLKRTNEILLEALSPAAKGGKAKSDHLSQRNLKLNMDEHPLPENAPSILVLMRNWVVKLITQGGAQKGVLQPSSIRTYWHRIAGPLLEFAWPLDFLALDEESLEALYIAILDARSPKGRTRRARVLRDFHQQCGGQLPDVDWYEIEPRINLDQQKVDAQVVTPAEFARACAGIKEQTVRPDYAHAIHFTLILQYRGGLRLGEVFRLTADDIRVRPDELLILVRRNRFGGPKTPAGRRIVRLKEPLLSSDERQLILDWLEFRKRRCQPSTECALLGPSSDGKELFDRSTFGHDVADVLRWATGRPTARSHHLRHSAGSYQMAAVIPPPEGSTVWQQVCDYWHSATPGPVVHQYFLNDPRPSRRVVHAISAQLGHASPRSTFTYLQLLDSALGRALWDASPARIDDFRVTERISVGEAEGESKTTWRGGRYGLAERLTGVSNDQLRQWVAQGHDVGDPRILAAKMLRRVRLPIGVDLEPRMAAPYEPSWARTDVRLEAIHLVLLEAESERPPEEIATHAGLSLDVTEKLLRAYRDNCGLCKYRRYDPDLDDAWTRATNGGIPAEEKGPDLYASFSKLLSMPEDHPALHGLNVWAANYIPSHTAITANNPANIKSLLALLQELTIPVDKVRISIPNTWKSSSNDIREETFFSDIEGTNYSECIRDYHAQHRQRARSDLPSIKVLLESATGEQKRSRDMTRFHQYCYLAWICRRAGLTH